MSNAKEYQIVKNILEKEQIVVFSIEKLHNNGYRASIEVSNDYCNYYDGSGPDIETALFNVANKYNEDSE